MVTNVQERTYMLYETYLESTNLKSDEKSWSNIWLSTSL